MDKKDSRKELDKRIETLESELIQVKQEAELVSTEKTIYASILANVPLFIMIVDQDRRVKNVSLSMLQFLGKTEEKILGLRGGEALRCAHHLDDPRGCGFGKVCDTCAIRNTIQDTLTTGNIHQGVEAKLSIMDDEVEERSFLVSTALLDADDKQAIVFVEDITERKKMETERENLINNLTDALSEVKTLSGLLPICSNCKNIRDDKGYWKKIESYIRDHSDANFSHSICPECAKLLYPDLNVDIT